MFAQGSRFGELYVSRALAACALALMLALASCVPTGRININYQPTLRTPNVINPTPLPVFVTVIDQRPTQILGHHVGAFGEKEGDIVTESDIPAVLKRAFEIELANEGFTIGPGGNNLIVTIAFLQGQYLHPLFHTKVVASMGIDVTIKSRTGLILYSAFVLGQSEVTGVESHIKSQPAEASTALNEATRKAIIDSFDSAFLAALQRH